MSPSAAATAPACARCEIHAESTFRVDGMCCGEEARILERRLGRLHGVEALAADVVAQRLRVTYDAALLSTNVIVDAVAETGMRAWLEHEQKNKDAEERRKASEPDKAFAEAARKAKERAEQERIDLHKKSYEAEAKRRNPDEKIEKRFRDRHPAARVVG